MILDENCVYVLNPDYVLRNDIHRIALYSKEKVSAYSSSDWNSFIHPIQGLLFSFFTYNRTLKTNLDLLSKFFHKDEHSLKRMIFPYIENETAVFTKWKKSEICLPKNLLIEKSRIASDFRFLALPIDYFICENIDLDTKRFYTAPLLLTFMLTNKCVTNCKYCYADTTTLYKQEISTKRLFELIQEASRLQVRQINLMGGEIFLHKDWDLILKELVRYDMSPEFISTKIPLTTDIITRLIGTGYSNVIQISLDACSASVLQDSLCVKNDYLDKVKHGLRLIDQSGLKYQVSSVLTTYNNSKSVLLELFHWLSSLEHLTDWRISPVSNSITIEYEKFKGIKLDQREILALFAYMEMAIIPQACFPILLNKTLLSRKFYTAEQGSDHFEGITCSALNTHLFVLPDGQATICEQLYWDERFIVGDLTVSGIVAVWNSEKALFLANLSRKDIHKESVCKVCELFDLCFKRRNRCWSDIIKAYGKEHWDFPDPRCKNAPSMNNHLGYK